MELHLDNTIENLLILGAGASVDFELPIWNELSSLIIDRIKNDKANRYKYKKEILDWLEKIVEKKLYYTLDECIAQESREKNYHSNGDYIENEIFHY